MTTLCHITQSETAQTLLIDLCKLLGILIYNRTTHFMNSV